MNALSHYEWIGILIARLSVGTLFALSGRGKLFVPSRREEMVRTLRTAAVAAPEANAVFVSLVEFVFGSGTEETDDQERQPRGLLRKDPGDS